MIKCETRNGNIEIETKGKLVEIVADSVVIFATLYKGIRKENRKMANEYMKMFLLGVTDVINEKY